MSAKAISVVVIKIRHVSFAINLLKDMTVQCVHHAPPLSLITNIPSLFKSCNPFNFISNIFKEPY